MSEDTTSSEVTRLIGRWKEGDTEALDALLPRLYDELRRLANSHLGRERRPHTLQPTALVHEVFLRWTGAGIRPEDRLHFFALASRTMRRVLIDHARRKQAAKRPSEEGRITLATDLEIAASESVDILDLHRALKDFARVSPRAAQVVEMRFFAGLTLDEVAEVLEISSKTVERDWTAAQLWLRHQLG